MSQNKSHYFVQLITIFFWFLCFYGAVHLLAVWALSFTMPRGDDVSFLYYLAWLINEHNYAPYKDLLDTSYPGTFILHAWIAELFGYSEISFHIVDSLYLTALLATTWALLRPVNIRIATAAVIVTGLYYFSTSSNMRFQRDYLCILPTCLALLVSRNLFFYPRVQFVLIGLLIGIAASIKPQFILGMPVVLVAGYFFRNQNQQHDDFKNKIWLLVCSLGGLGAWLVFCLAWLYWHNGLAGFHAMATKFLPLYMKLDGGHSATSGYDFWNSFLEQLWQTSRETWLLILLVVVYVGRQDEVSISNKFFLVTTFILFVLGFVYVIVAKKGWDYHWAPFTYFAIVLSAFLLQPFSKTSFLQALMYCLATTVFVVWHIRYFESPHGVYAAVKRVINEYPYAAAVPDYANELQVYLGNKIRTDDVVEVRVTGTGGGIFESLLKLHLVPATSYPIHLMLYRNTDHPYIQELRQELLKQLDSPPRYLLDDNQFSLLAKPDGSPGFPEYEEFLQKNYRLVYDNRDHAGIPYQFLIYQRIDTIQ